MSPLARVAGVAVAALAALGMAAASHTTLPTHRSDDAMLRVAWSARPERMERCRTLGEEELEALPAHMRQRVVCEGVTARYRFEALVDGVELASAELRGGGLRHDRHLYMFREISLPAGRAVQLEVRLTRLTPEAARDQAGTHASVGREELEDSPAGRDARESEEHRRRVEDEIPATLRLRETITLGPREVVLVTYDRDDRRLRLVRREP